METSLYIISGDIYLTNVILIQLEMLHWNQAREDLELLF